MPLPRKLLASLAGLAAVAAAWFFFAPGALGGWTNYVITSGISMEPRFHTGDLVVVRAATDYRVGEVVAYRSRSLETIVLHRIVARDAGGYVFKGDNNNFRDPEHVTRNQFVGKVWLRAPGMGTHFGTLRTPRVVGLLGGLAAMLLVSGTAAATGRRSRRRRSEAGGAAGPARRAGPPQAARAGLGIATAALIAFLALGALAFTRPTHRTATATAAYTQTGTFSYSASAPAGVVYPTGRAKTGDPLFVRLVDRARVRFDYRLDSRFPRAVAGHAALRAEIASSNGWKRVLELQPSTSFRGDRVVVGGTLRLRAVERLLRRVETATAMSGVVTYTLTLVPHVRISGQLAGARLSETFTPRVPFALDPLQLRPELPADADPASATDSNAAFTASSGGTVETAHIAARELTFRGVGVAVRPARQITAVGAAGALCALLAFALLVLRGRAADEPARIQARYRDLLIPVTRTERRSYDEVVELESFEALTRLAERYDRMILHEQSPLGHSYRIADEGLLYIYLVGDDRGLLPQPASDLPEPASARERTPERRRSSWWKKP